MSPNARLGWATLAACAFLSTCLAAILAVLGSGLDAGARDSLAGLLDRQFGAVLMLLLVAFAFVFMLLRAAHEHLLLLPGRVAEEAAALADQPALRLTPRGSPELQALIGAINRLAEQRQAGEAGVEARVRTANALAEAERNRFAALIAELAQGVVVCNRDGRILLYNRRARSLFAPDGVSGALGLGRSVYGILDRHLIAYALENIAERRGGHRHFVAAGLGGRLLRVVVAPVAEEGAMALAGYLLMVEDMTEAFDSESIRDRLLHELTEKSRGAVANLRAAAETLHDYTDMEAAERARFIAVVRDEARVIGDRVAAAADEFASVLKARWPVEAMLGSELLAAAATRIGERCGLPVSLEAEDAELWLRIDGFSLLQAIGYLALRLHADYAVRELQLRLAGDGRMAHLDLIWQGVSMSTETAMNWELDPMHDTGEASPLTVRDVIERCGGEVWYQRERAAHRAFFRFLLPLAAGSSGRAPAAQPRVDSRPEFYDFDLFRSDDAAAVSDDRMLAQLIYTVFDTETTGLDPSAGDEIIQIGAVRVLNRRILRQETFEQLVDPQRPVPARSVRIHGISGEMLAGQPPIAVALQRFRAFVADTVLVAHNAAFDMRFLELKETATGVRFDRPVLDTFLLSAVLFPQQETHRLEAIAERLGVSVFGRHTAVGDAIVTAEVFIKMIPLLADKGIRSLREAIDASHQTYLARIRY